MSIFNKWRVFSAIVAFAYLILSAPLALAEEMIKVSSQDPHFSELLQSPLTLKKQTPLNIDILLSLISDELTIDYSDFEFDQMTGRSKIVNLVISDINSNLALNIGNLSIWGANLEALSGALSDSKKLSELKIADRIMLQNVSVTGLEEYFYFLESNEDLDPQVFYDLTKEWTRYNKQEVRPDESYRFNIGAIVLTDLILGKPLNELTSDSLRQDDETWLDALIWKFTGTELPIGGILSKYFDSPVSFSDFAIYDFGLSMFDSRWGTPVSHSMGFELFGVNQYSVSDLELATLQSFSLHSKISIPKNSKFTEYVVADAGIELGELLIENITLSNLIEHLKKVELPPPEKHDFMSLGSFKLEEMSAIINNTELYQFDIFALDLRKFHWIIPHGISLEVENSKGDFAAVIDLILTTNQQMSWLDVDALGLTEYISKLQQFITLMEKYDLAAPSFDVAVDLQWEPDSGKVNTSYIYGIDKVAQFEASLNGGTITYDQLINLMNNDLNGNDVSDREELLLRSTVLKQLSGRLVDAGGLESLTSLAIDLGNNMPAIFHQLGFLEGATSDEFRTYMAQKAMVHFSDDKLPIDVSTPVVQFLEKGGSVNMRISPKGHINLYDIIYEEMGDLHTLPDSIKIDVFHLEP